MKTIRLFFSIILLGLLVNNIHAQTNEKFVSVKSTMGGDVYSTYTRMNIGLSYEHQFSKYFAYNFGMEYKGNIYAMQLPFTINYVSIPLNVKFVSNIVNVSLGVYLDHYTGLSTVNNSTITNFSTNTLQFGASLELSKNISISKYIIIEPEISLDYTIFGFFEYNAGLNLKYRIPDKFKAQK